MQRVGGLGFARPSFSPNYVSSGRLAALGAKASTKTWAWNPTNFSPTRAMKRWVLGTNALYTMRTLAAALKLGRSSPITLLRCLPRSVAADLWHTARYVAPPPPNRNTFGFVVEASQTF